MLMRRLGRTGLKVAALCLGGNTFGWTTAHRPGITAPIASATSAAQVKELAGGIELRLDAEATAALEQASAWRDA